MLSDLTIQTSGKGWTDSEAKASCTFEAVERYSALFTGSEELIRNRFPDLRRIAVDPRRLLEFSERQYDTRESWNAAFGGCQYIPERWDESKKLEWVMSCSLQDGHQKFVPAEAVFLRYVPSEPHIFFRNETIGCAAAVTLDEAIVRGFLELVERDAIALWWYNRCSRPGINMQSFRSKRISQATKHLGNHRRNLHALDLTTDCGIPVVAAVSATNEGEAALFGFAAEFDAALALEKAVAELLQVLGPVQTWSRQGMLDHYTLNVDRRVWIQYAKTFEQRYLLPSTSPERTITDFAKQVPPPEKRLDRCVEVAASLGMDLLFVNLTRESIGTPVVRVIVPGLRSSWPRLAPGRLYEVPVKLGWRTYPCVEEQLNSFPFFL